MLFNFELFDIDDIAPVVTNDGQKVLCWYWLSLGRYWIDVGTDQLLRFTDEIISFWGNKNPTVISRPYIDHQVSRFWEDLMKMIPRIMEPIPGTVLQKIKIGNDAVSWSEKVEDYLNNKYEPNSTEYCDNEWNTTNWIYQRLLVLEYINPPVRPNIWFWSDGSNVYIHWDNREVYVNEIPVWTAKYGTFSTPVSQFIESIRLFDHNLISAMESRVNQIKENWPYSDIYIDVPKLIQAQDDRSTWMESWLTHYSGYYEPYPWDEVLNMLEKVHL